MRRKVSLFINIFIFSAVPVSWYYMFLHHGGLLGALGFGSLRYFTVLSNILMGAASLVWVLAALFADSVPRWASRLKLVATASVALTFLTVMGFLGPIFGFPGMFRGANLFFHLIVPVLALVDFALFGDFVPTLGETALCVIPMLLYGTVYTVNILLNGIEGNDLYGFLNWGWAVGAAIFAVLTLVTWLSGMVLRLCARGMNRG